MKLFLTSAYEVHTMLDALLVFAESDVVRHHQICSRPEDADIILFVEDGQFDDYLYKRLSMHTLVKRFPDKTFMYNEVDKPWCVLPGLYCNMPRRFFQPKRQSAMPMLTIPNDLVGQIYDPADHSERKWLYSFVGAASHRCRTSIFKLADHSEAIQDTSDFNVWEAPAEVRLRAERNYADIMADSLFVLCPRGIGTSSYRLFETLQAGRAPVVISDQWVEPPHIDWDFIIRIPESDVARIPEVLQGMAGEARARGEAARAAWEQAYAPDVMFNTIAETLVALKESLGQEVVAPEPSMTDQLRKLVIKNEVDALAMGRKLRDRVSAFLAPLETPGR